MAACQEVFGIFELLEHIILQMEWRKIHVVQGVSKHWQHIIHSSDYIQESLFRKPPIPSVMTWTIKTTRHEKCMLNDNFPESQIWRGWPRPQPVLNPVAVHFLRNPPPIRWHVAELEFAYRSVGFEQGAVRLAKLHAPDASWRSMQLTSPPTVRLNIVCYGHVGDATNHMGREVPVENPKGITVDDFVYALCGHWYRCRDCPLSRVLGQGFVNGPSKYVYAPGWDFFSMIRAFLEKK